MSSKNAWQKRKYISNREESMLGSIYFNRVVNPRTNGLVFLQETGTGEGFLADAEFISTGETRVPERLPRLYQSSILPISFWPQPENLGRLS
jgi:hypothetical protein